MQYTRRQSPSEFLKKIVGKPVVVKLNSGADYRGNKKCFDFEINMDSLLLGILSCLDGFMNIALEQTEEYFGGQLKNK